MLIRRIGVLVAAWLLVGLLGLPTGVTAQPNLDALAAQEKQDLGVAPSAQLHAGAMHGPTPTRIPGGKLVTTAELVAMAQARQVPFFVLDALGQPETLPNAVPAAWLAQAGTFDDGVQQQAVQALRQLTQGRQDVALVFYCLSRECWMSYNAALRAIRAGYTNVLWYRGGLESWKAAGLPTQNGSMQGGGPTPGGPAAGGPAVGAPGQGGPMQGGPMQGGPMQGGPMQGGGPMPGGPGMQAGGGGFQGGAPMSADPRAQGGGGPSRFTPVQPVARAAMPPGAQRPAAPELTIGQGRFFAFALPPGWRVGEDGQYALTLMSPDNLALTLMVGNAGSPINLSPAKFAYDKLSATRPQNLQVGNPRQVAPAAGFPQAVQYDVSYLSRGIAYRGVAKVSVAPAYDTATLVMTAALAPAEQWAGYAGWLPQVADQISATNGGAFGRRGVMAQNLQNSTAFAQAARDYREWSQKNWQGVVDQRNASQDRRNFAVRENLGGVQTFANPFGTPPVELPTTNKYYWADRNGKMVGTDDPSANPNTGSTGEWRRMERTGPP